jgi:drug/metabolite transporter (DMT)-like permease
MARLFPLIFILLWSSAFITTKPIVDNSNPFAALCFRFFLVSFGFYLFVIYKKYKIINLKKNILNSVFSGILFHGVYLGGVFFFNFKRFTHWNNCLNSNFTTYTN